MALCQRRLTTRQLRDRLRTAKGTLVLDQTIRNRLRTANLHARRPAVRPSLLPRQRAAKRDWRVHHLRWARNQWGSVIVWDAFSFNFRTPLYVVNGNLNGDRYPHEIIQPLVMPTLERIGAGGWFSSRQC